MLHSDYGGMGQACDLFSPVVCVLRINLQRQVIFTCILTQCVIWFFVPSHFHMYSHTVCDMVLCAQTVPYVLSHLFLFSFFLITNERHFEFLQTLHIAD
jgi:hypothetical protein